MAKKQAPIIVEEGEAWLGSYADLMTLLLCFFILLFSFSHPDPGKLETMAQALSKEFKGETVKKNKDIVSKVGVNHEIREIRALHMLVSLLGLGDTENAVKKIEDDYIKSNENKKIKEKVKGKLKNKAKGLKFLSSNSKDVTVKLSIPSNILFLSGSDRMSNEASVFLDGLAKSISDTKDLKSVKIVGHTDSRPVGRGSKFRDNWTLSFARSASVAKHLIARGISPKDIDTSGAGHHKPLVPEFKNGRAILANMAKNRRIEIEIVKLVNEQL